jgi:hypothetical protein
VALRCAYSVHSVHPSIWVNQLDSLNRFSLNLIMESNMILSSHFNFNLNRTVLLTTLHEELYASLYVCH